MELSVVEVLFNRGTRGALINLPPLAAALTFTSMLKQRIDLPVQSFKAMPHPYVSRSIEHYFTCRNTYHALDVTLRLFSVTKFGD